jgi:RNA polymerase sigma factor for flagellar operon FliA
MRTMTLPHPAEGRTRRLPPGDPERLIAEYAPAIQAIARRVATWLPPGLAVEDLIQVGVLGLMAARGKYDATRDDTFPRYARCRIQGAMLDEVRQRDWRPRSLHERGMAITRATADLEQQLGRAPEAADVATRLGLPLETFYQWRQQVHGGTWQSLDGLSQAPTEEETAPRLDVVAMAEAPSPEAQAYAQQRRALLAHAIDALPAQAKVVLSLYYYEDLTMREIGEVLQLSESRVSQMHTKALAQLRPLLTDSLDT